MKINIEFLTPHNKWKEFIFVILDNNGKLVSSTSEFLGDILINDQYIINLCLHYKLGYYLLIISTDGIAYILNNSFIFTTKLKHSLIYYKGKSNTLFSNLQSINETSFFKNITRYINKQCSTNICLIEQFFIDIMNYINPKTPPDITININNVTPEVPMDTSDTNNKLWVIIPIIGIIITIVVIIFIIYLLIRPKKDLLYYEY